jgi:hypothetical protein
MSQWRYDDINVITIEYCDLFNIGTCIRTNEEPYGGCSCPAEFSGPTCSNDPCTPSPCLNGGYCIRKPDNQFYCQCRNRNKGVYCERELHLFLMFEQTSNDDNLLYFAQ